MLRLLACVLAGVLGVLPASAQTLRSMSDGQSAQLSASSLTTEGPVAVQLNRADFAASSNDRHAVRSQAGAVAATIFRVLASQNTIHVGSTSRLNAVLHPPESSPSSSETSLFIQAKSLYDTATSYRTDRFDVVVDPLSLRCHLRFKLSSLGSN